MADVYARNAAARDLRLLDLLIKEVRCGAFKPDESRAGRLDASKRQRVDDFTCASELLESMDPIGDINNTHEQFRLDAEPEEGQAVETGDCGDEAEGYVTTDSSSSDTDEGEREVVQRQFFPPDAPEHFHSCNTRSPNCFTISEMEM